MIGLFIYFRSSLPFNTLQSFFFSFLFSSLEGLRLSCHPLETETRFRLCLLIRLLIHLSAHPGSTLHCSFTSFRGKVAQAHPSLFLFGRSAGRSCISRSTPTHHCHLPQTRCCYRYLHSRNSRIPIALGWLVEAIESRSKKEGEGRLLLGGCHHRTGIHSRDSSRRCLQQPF